MHTGIITIAMINEVHGKCLNLTKSIAKGSTASVVFNDDSWGNVSWSFAKSTASVAQSVHQFERIEETEKEYSKGNTQVTESLNTVLRVPLWLMTMIVLILLIVTVMMISHQESGPKRNSF